MHYVATLTGGFFAFTNWTGLGDWEFIGLDNFVRIFNDPQLLGAVWNTLFLAFGSVILTNVFGLLFALAINRMLKSRYILRTLLFMPVVLSPLAVAYVWKFIFQFNGPLNGLLGLLGLEELQKVWLADPTWSIWAILITVVWQQTGFTMVIYLAGLASVPVEVEEAAALDGAGIWGRFWNVTVPAIRPSIAIATTLGIIQGLRIFDQILALTGGGPAGRDRDPRDRGLQAGVLARPVRVRLGARAGADRHHPGVRHPPAVRHPRPRRRKGLNHVPLHQSHRGPRSPRLDRHAPRAAAVLHPDRHLAEDRRGGADHAAPSRRPRRSTSAPSSRCSPPPGATASR